MKVTIEEEELWPMYIMAKEGDTLYYDSNRTVEVDDDLIRRYEEAEEKFFDVQDELRNLID